jgi:hypothetical protein
MFLKGFTSTYWNDIQCKYPMVEATIQKWDTSLVCLLINLYKSLWDDRNSFLHGRTWQELRQKLRERVVDHVKSIYKSPPKLHPCFQKIHLIPLESRI